MEQNQQVVFKDARIDLMDCYNFVKSPKCGAINMFIGTIRDTDIKVQPKLISGQMTDAPSFNSITSIHYEAYESMAAAQVSKIIQEVLGGKGCPTPSDEISRACVAIRLGDVPIGEASIIIGVSSKSRELSHIATMKILNRIKSDVVIWKKIIFKDGSEQWDTEVKSEAAWLNRKSAR